MPNGIVEEKVVSRKAIDALFAKRTATSEPRKTISLSQINALFQAEPQPVGAVTLPPPTQENFTRSVFSALQETRRQLEEVGAGERVVPRGVPRVAKALAAGAGGTEEFVRGGVEMAGAIRDVIRGRPLKEAVVRGGFGLLRTGLGAVGVVASPFALAEEAFEPVDRVFDRAVEENINFKMLKAFLSEEQAELVKQGVKVGLWVGVAGGVHRGAKAGRTAINMEEIARGIDRGLADYAKEITRPPTMEEAIPGFGRIEEQRLIPAATSGGERFVQAGEGKLPPVDVTRPGPEITTPLLPERIKTPLAGRVQERTPTGKISKKAVGEQLILETNEQGQVVGARVAGGETVIERPAPPQKPEALHGLPDWLRERLESEGKLGRIFNDYDLADPNVREAIKADPTLTTEQKKHLLKTGVLLPKPEVVKPTGPAIEQVIKEAGGEPRGTGKNGLVYFDDPQTGSTKAFKPGEPITPETVKAKLEQGRTAFAEGEKPKRTVSQKQVEEKFAERGDVGKTAWKQLPEVTTGGKVYFWSRKTPRGRVSVVWERFDKKWIVTNELEKRVGQFDTLEKAKAFADKVIREQGDLLTVARPVEEKFAEETEKLSAKELGKKAMIEGVISEKEFLNYVNTDTRLGEQVKQRALEYLRANPVEAREVIRRQEGEAKLAEYEQLLRVKGKPVPVVGAKEEKAPTPKKKIETEQRLQVILGGSNRLLKRQRDALTKAGIPHQFGYWSARKGHWTKSTWYVPDTPEAQAFVRQIGGTIPKDQPSFLKREIEGEQPTKPSLEIAPAPVAVPGPQWTGDRGAMPGEPYFYLDVPKGGALDQARAVIIGQDTPTGAKYSASIRRGDEYVPVLDDRGNVRLFDTAKEAAEIAEAKSESLLPVKVEKPTGRPSPQINPIKAIEGMFSDQIAFQMESNARGVANRFGDALNADRLAERARMFERAAENAETAGQTELAKKLREKAKWDRVAIETMTSPAAEFKQRPSLPAEGLKKVVAQYRGQIRAAKNAGLLEEAQRLQTELDVLVKKPAAPKPAEPVVGAKVGERTGLPSYEVGKEIQFKTRFGLSIEEYSFPAREIKIAGHPKEDVIVYSARSGWIAYDRKTGEALGKQKAGVGWYGFDTAEKAITNFINVRFRPSRVAAKEEKPAVGERGLIAGQRPRWSIEKNVPEGIPHLWLGKSKETSIAGISRTKTAEGTIYTAYDRDGITIGMSKDLNQLKLQAERWAEAREALPRKPNEIVELIRGKTEPLIPAKEEKPTIPSRPKKEIEKELKEQKKSFLGELERAKNVVLEATDLKELEGEKAENFAKLFDSAINAQSRDAVVAALEKAGFKIDRSDPKRPRIVTEIPNDGIFYTAIDQIPAAIQRVKSRFPTKLEVSEGVVQGRGKQFATRVQNLRSDLEEARTRLRAVEALAKGEVSKVPTRQTVEGSDFEATSEASGETLAQRVVEVPRKLLPEYLRRRTTGPAIQRMWAVESWTDADWKRLGFYETFDRAMVVAANLRDSAPSSPKARDWTQQLTKEKTTKLLEQNRQRVADIEAELTSFGLKPKEAEPTPPKGKELLGGLSADESVRLIEKSLTPELIEQFRQGKVNPDQLARELRNKANESIAGSPDIPPAQKKEIFSLLKGLSNADIQTIVRRRASLDTVERVEGAQPIARSKVENDQYLNNLIESIEATRKKPKKGKERIAIITSLRERAGTYWLEGLMRGLKGTDMTEYVRGKLIEVMEQSPAYKELSPATRLRAFKRLETGVVETWVRWVERGEKKRLATERAEELQTRIRNDVLDRYLKSNLSKEDVQQVIKLAQDMGKRIPTDNQGKLLAQFKSRISVAVDSYGAAGARLIQRLYAGDLRRSELVEMGQVFIRKIEDVFNRIETPFEWGRVGNAVADALQNRKEAPRFLDTKAKQEVYTQARNMFDTFRAILKDKGYPVEEDYFPHIAQRDLSAQIFDDPATWFPGKGKPKTVQQVISEKSPFLKPRMDIEFEIRKDPLNVLRVYLQSVTRELAYKDAMEYFQNEFLLDIPPGLKPQGQVPSLQRARDAVNASLNPVRPKGEMFRFLNWVRNNMYPNFLRFNLKSSMQNMTQWQLAKLRWSPEAIRLETKLWHQKTLITDMVADAMDASSRDVVKWWELAREAMGGEKRIDEFLNQHDTFQLAERRNWKRAELGSIFHSVMREKAFPEMLKRMGGDQLRAVNALLKEKEVFDRAVTEAAITSAETQVSPQPAMRAEFFDAPFMKILGMFVAFKTRQFQIFWETLGRYEGINGLRSKLILRRALAGEIEPVEVLRRVEGDRVTLEGLLKDARKNKEDIGIPHDKLQQFIDHIKREEKDLNNIIKEIEPANKAKNLLALSRYFGKVYAISFAFSFLWDSADIAIFGEDDEKNIIARTFWRALLDVSPMPFYGTNPSKFLTPPTFPNLENMFVYGNFSARGLGRDALSFGLNAVPYGGFVDRATGKRISKGIVDLLFPKKSAKKGKGFIKR